MPMDLPAGYDLRTLWTFVVVADAGGMTAAARRLGLSQSTVSQIIGNLETAVGTALFDRSVRPLALTAAGSTLYEQGGRLLAQANALLQGIREDERRALSRLTLAMAESFANTVGPILLREMAGLAQRWRIWSGISPEHHRALLDRTVDVVVTGAEDLDVVEGLERHTLFTEPFLLVFPATYDGPVNRLAQIEDLPFIRYSLRSNIGRQIESQINRLRLDLPIQAEFDTASGQLAAVADGMGWSMTTPLCLIQERWQLPNLRVEPMPRGRFSRRISLVARAGNLGSVPARLAVAARRIMRDRCLPHLTESYPWVAGQMVWEDEK